MKTLLRPVVLLALINIAITTFGQTAGVALDKNSRVWVGVNAGALWENSDVKSAFGAGYGLTFDYYFIRNNTSIFGLGVRGQFLKGTTKGLGVTRDFDIQNNTSLNGTSGNPNYASLAAGQNYVFQNYSTDIADLSGNVIITLNRLRAVSKLNVYVFGGLGGTDYIASMNQLDASGSLYGYDLVSATGNNSSIKKDLRKLLDDTYETYSEKGSKRSRTINATVGAGFGIQLTDRIQVGVEHKVGFTGTDLLDANQWSTTNSRNDVYHYSSLGVNIGFGRMSRNQPTVRTRPIVPVKQTRVSPPVIRVTNPASSPVKSENCIASVAAIVENISNKQSITVTRNGAVIDFDFFSNTVSISDESFTGTIEFVIRATNESGTVEQSASFVCEPQPRVELITICHRVTGGSIQTIDIPLTDWDAHAAHGDIRGACPVIPAPIITITSPTSSPVTLENCVASVIATVENISDKQNITVTRNGSPVAFTFSRNTVTISNVSFTGTANFIIRARNSSGATEQTISFICRPPVEMISICHHVAGAAPQSITIPITEWTLHAAHGDTRGTCPVIPAPSVTITSPTSSPVTLENCVASVSATVENISDKQFIVATQNGTPVPFEFSGNRVTISNVSFTGTANFVVRATNASGTAEQTVSFICKPPVEMISICHHVAGAAPQSITIPITEWTLHTAHGDSRGTCPVIPAPSVTITSPTSSPVTLENCVASISAAVENISDKQFIVVTQNGSPVPFEFSGNRVTISNVSFTGTANFVVRATNASGTAEQTVSFICKPPLEMISICHHVAGAAPQSISIPITEWTLHAAHGDTRGTCPVILAPSVTITSPTSSPVTLENCVASVSAAVENISDKQFIVVTQNGTPVPFEFSGNRVTISNVSFTGTANFVVRATNASGTAEQTVSFICKPPVEMISICHHVAGAAPQSISIPITEWTLHTAHGDTRGTCPVILAPSVTITSPTSSPVTLENCVASVSAAVENISDKQFIVVTQNGTPVPFEFSGNRVTISNVSFTGTANFVIRATNASGTAEQTVSFICKPPVEMISICHHVAGAAPQSISIPITEWTLHTAHGDTRGTCPVIPAPSVTITSPTSSPVTLENCVASISAAVENISDKQFIVVTQNGSPVPFEFSGNRVTISSVSLTGTANFVIRATNASGAAEQTVSFICKPPLEMISICHHVAGAAPQSISIPITEWTLHAAHGDTRGTCPVILAPSVTITSPTSSPVTLENCVASVSAAVENISDKQFIVVTQNGTPVPFEFSGNRVTISNVSFTGTANFVVRATNASGTAEQTVSFICKPPVEMISICHHVAGAAPQSISIPITEWTLHTAHGDTRGTCPVIPAPSVTITSPTSSPVTLENCVASISAAVENISDKQFIVVTQNGSPVPFEFSGNRVTISSVSLTGTANFVIRATNASGTAEQTVSFICKPPLEMISICHHVAGAAPQSISIPITEWTLHAAHGDTRGTCPLCEPPTVAINTPVNNSSLPNAFLIVSATVANVIQNQISVKHNGSPVQFTLNNNVVSASLNASPGSNSIDIAVTNDCGSQTASTVVNYNPCIPPTVTISSPINNASIATAGFTLTAHVTNTTQNRVSVKLNGVSVSFNLNGNVVSTELTAVTGANTITIGVANECGNNTADATVTFTPPPTVPDPNFTIGGNGTVTVNTNVCATVKCIGEDVMYNNTEQAFVKIGVTTNGSTWYGFNGNNNLAGGEQETILVPNGGQVALNAYCYNASGNWNNTLTSNSGSQWIYVLKNGDKAPNIPPAQGQSPVAKYLKGVLVNGKISLGPDDVIYLFELRHVGNVGVDYQDVIMLITFAEGSSCSEPTLPFVTVVPPVVSITSPTTSPVTTENCVASITATVENISSKQNISVTRNGSPVNFNFTGNTVRISNVGFTGTTDFVIKATNASGTAEQSVSFVCKPKEKEITICHYPPGNRNNPQAITIPESAWSAHEAHGDTQGECPVIPAPVVTITSPNTSPVTTEDCIASITATVEHISDKQSISVTQNGSAVDFNFSGNKITISNVGFTGTADFVIKATNASGNAQQSVSFICKPKEKEITICHYPPGNRNNPQAITIPESAWGAHEAHGDTQGACPVIPAPVVTITSPNTSPVTTEDCIASITATVEHISDKQSISVTQNGSAVDFNFSGNNVTISNVSFTGTADFVIKATNASGTAQQSVSFICKPKEKEITICHYPPGNRNNPQAITIPESAWAAHEAHGDTQGACPVIPAPVVTITSPNTSPVTTEDCTASITATVEHISDKQNISVTQNGSAVDFNFSGNNVTISNVSFTGTADFVIKATNASGTAQQSVSFVCEPKKITICHYPPGNRDNAHEITISESAWSAHEAHGDTQGACPVIPEPELTINSPEASPATVEDCKASVQASVKHVSGKGDISVTQNGRSVRFDYSDGTIQVSDISFTDAATIVIVASNKSGTVTRTVEFKCPPKDEEKPKNEGDRKPESEDEKITICHHPTDNSENFQTITISASEWPEHEKHGDTKGPCTGQQKKELKD